MVDCMPNRISSMAIAKQIVRSGTSPAANKLNGLQQEARELYKIIVSSIVTTRNRLAKEV